jgi:magnesium transporter
MSKKTRHRKGRAKGRESDIQPGPFDMTELPELDHQPTRIDVTIYDTSSVQEESVENVEAIRDFLGAGKTAWIRVRGLKESGKVGQIAQILGLHHLALEDVFVTQQRARLAQFDRTFFLVTNILENKDSFQAKQLSMFFAEDFVITFELDSIENLDHLRARIKSETATIHAQKAGYLVYLILDTAVDTYFPILEEFGEKLDDLEESAIEDPSRRTMAAIHAVKRQLLVMRRAIWPLREAINALLRDGSFLLSSEARIHLRDCYDEIVRVIDFIETYRELGADLMDVYLSSVSNRLNEIMKVLTIITVVFAPPTLIAGIYGMNFNHQVSPFNMNFPPINGQ